MVDPINIKFSGQHGSIGELTWAAVPQFAVLTGKNGAGKSQLLEVIARTYNVAITPRNGNPRYRQDGILPSAHALIEGDVFNAGEVFHSYSHWGLPPAGVSSDDQVRQAIRDLLSGWNNSTQQGLMNDLAERTGLTTDQIRNLSSDDLGALLTPIDLWGARLPHQPQSLSFLFLAYSLWSYYEKVGGLSEEKILAKLGDKPWDVFNEILEAAGLPFTVAEPIFPAKLSWMTPTTYTIQLRDVERGLDVPFESLSSGEQVLMSMALWLLADRATGRHHKLLLLDEPDAHLHPSMTRKFLNVIRTVFVEKRGVRVIMTTHSPSTVALVPVESLFEMRRSEPRIVKVEHKASAISNLTDGFVVAHEGMRIVLCEGVWDHKFYPVVWDLLTDPLCAGDAIAAREPQILFLYGQGKDTVTQIVPEMRRAGLMHFHGIIDRDINNQPKDGISVLGRRAIENYIYDPLNVWSLLHQEGEAPSALGVDIPRGQRARVTTCSEVELQAIVDSTLATLSGQLSADVGAVPESDAIMFSLGRTVRYPKWFLTCHKSSLIEADKKAFPRLKGFHDKDFTTSYATLNLIPADLKELLLSIQQT